MIVKNIIIILISVIVGAAIGFFSSTLAIKAQQPVLIEAIRKETSKVENKFINEFDKIKNKKGEPINIFIDPKNESAIFSDTTKFVRVKSEKGFFKRLFNKN